MEACPVAQRSQDPDLKNGLGETSGCVSPRPSHVQATSLGDLEKREIRTLGKHAFLQSDGFRREVFLRSPVKWNPKGVRRILGPHAPAYGLYDAPAAFRAALQRYLVRSDNSSACVGLNFHVPSFDPCQFFVSRRSGGQQAVFLVVKNRTFCCSRVSTRRAALGTWRSRDSTLCV